MPLAAHEAQTYFETGVRAFTEGKYDEAVTALTQAITSYPHYAQAHYMLGNTLSAAKLHAGATNLRARRGELPRVC
jgi:TolA-binding protein